MTPSLFCVLDPLLDILHGRQLAFQFFRQVAGDLIGADADGLAHILERILGHEVVLALAEQQANRRIVLLFFQDTIHGRKVEVKLPCVFRLELAGLQLDYHIAAEVEVIEQQVDVEVIAAYVEVVLVAEKRKAGSQLQQELCHILDQSLLNVTLYHMLIDHAGATLFPQCDILRSIGRVSFPLYAFLLAQGCKHTHSMERYLLGLGIFALISEIPYDLAFGNSINFLDQTNIFYTLFLSAACVYIYDSIKKQKTMIQLIVFAVCLLFLFMEWILLTFITGERLPSLALMFSYVMGMIISCAHIFKHHEIANSKSNILINIFPILSTLPAFLLASFIDCDYGIWGVALISLLYLAKSIKISAVIMAVLLVPYYGQHIYSNVVSFEAIRNMCFSLLSILFVCLYNGQHGSKKKWIYYWAYPLHILFFAILRCYPFF